MGYNFTQTNQQGGLERFEGFKLLKGKSHFVERPRGEKGFTRFRILPAVEAGKPVLNPFNPANPEEFGDWLHVASTISYWGIGKNRLTCLAQCSDTPPDEKPPCEVFFWAIVNAMKSNDNAHAGWKVWADKNASRENKAFSSPRPTAFLQAVVSHAAGKPLKNAAGKMQPKYPAVLTIPSSILNPEFPRSLVNVLTARGSDGNLTVGDFLGEGRSFDLLYVPSSGAMMSHYDLEMTLTTLPDGSEGPPQKVPLRKEWVAAWKPWSEILRQLTELEQVEILSRYFPADAVDFAFGNSRFSAYIPPPVRGAWYGRNTTVAVAYQPQVVAQNPATVVPAAVVEPPPAARAPAEEAPWGGPAEINADDPWGNSAPAPEGFNADDGGQSDGSDMDPAAGAAIAANVKARLLAARQAPKQ